MLQGGGMIHRIGRRQASLLAAVVSVCTVVATVLAHPAGAEPAGPAVPDAGARPPAAAVGAGASTPTQTVPTGLSPAAQQLQTETFAVQALAEQLKKLDEDVTQAQSDVLAKRNAMNDTERRLADLREQAASAAADAYKASRALGPLGEYANDLHKLSKVTPAIGTRAGGEGAARELARAEAAARAAVDDYRAAQNTQTDVTARREALKLQYDQRSAALATLTANQATNAEIDAYEAGIGAGYDLGANADGLVPNPLVAQVLDFAKKQLGKPYVFGDEGPGSYDCSGLVWASYRTVGKSLPRIANEQYRDTPKVDRGKLIAGDLVFFGPPGSWVGIHHVGIYIGGGKMIQAPTTGDVVKISTVWWSRYYGAARPLPAVANPSAPPTTSAPPGSTPPSSTPPSSTPPSSTPPSSTPPSSTPPSSTPPSSTSPSSRPPSQSPSGSSGGSSATPSKSPSASAKSSTSSAPAAKPSTSPSSAGGSGSSGP